MSRVVLALGLVASALLAAQPGFDPKDVVRRVEGNRGHDRVAEFDSGEFLIDRSVSAVFAPAYQLNPSIATNDAVFFAVWEYRRAGLVNIVGTRVTPGGVVLDPSGIVVSSAPDEKSHPAVASDGSGFLVVWQNLESRDSEFISGARVSAAGALLDTLPIVISRGRGQQEHPAVGYSGTNYLVAWEDWRTRHQRIYAARVSSDGSVLDTANFPVATVPNYNASPDIASDGQNFLVVWDYVHDLTGYADICGARVTQGGVVLDSPAVSISTFESRKKVPAVSFDGTNYLGVWEDDRSDTIHDIYGARVTRGGTLLDTAGIPICTDPGGEHLAASCSDGANCLIAWRDYRGDSIGIFGTRVTPAGVVLDSSGFPILSLPSFSNEQGPAVGFVGGWFLVVTTDWHNQSEKDITGARVSPAGKVQDTIEIPISTAVDEQSRPAACGDGTNYLVVWQDHRQDTTCEIRGARVTQRGATLEPGSLEVSGKAGDARSPSVQRGRTNSLVAWQDLRNGRDYDIYGTRITPEGLVLDTSGIPISVAERNQGPAAVAHDGTNYLVTWMDFRGGSWNIYGSRMTEDGRVIESAGVAICTAPRYQENPSLEFGRTDYLVVWQDQRNGDWDIYGARVAPNGTVLDTSGIVLLRMAQDQELPALAFDGLNFLVAWQDRRNDVSWRIYCSRVTPQGTVLDPEGIALPAALGDQKYPAVTFDGTDFIVVWSDSSDTSWNICGVRVSSAGQVTDTFPVVMQNGNQTRPALAHGAGDQLFLAYQGWAGTVAGKTYNTDRIWGKLGPFTGIAAEPSARPRTCLLAVEPNPVSNACRISLNLNRPEKVSLRLCDATGRFVKTLFEGKVRAGTSDLALRTSDFPAGVYFLRLETPELQESRKLILAE
jgi:hypothetical protein